jgi:hypothetical protein
MIFNTRNLIFTSIVIFSATNHHLIQEVNAVDQLRGGTPEHHVKQPFPELVGKTGEEARQYLIEKYGENGYYSNRNTTGYCYARNIDYGRVCWEEDDNGLIVSTPFSG